MAWTLKRQLPKELCDRVKTYHPKLKNWEQEPPWRKTDCPHCGCLDVSLFYLSGEGPIGHPMITVCHRCKNIFGGSKDHSWLGTPSKITNGLICEHCIKNKVVHGLLFYHTKQIGKFVCNRKWRKDYPVIVGWNRPRVGRRPENHVNSYVEGVHIDKVKLSHRTIVQVKVVF